MNAITARKKDINHLKEAHINQAHSLQIKIKFFYSTNALPKKQVLIKLIMKSNYKNIQEKGQKGRIMPLHFTTAWEDVKPNHMKKAHINKEQSLKQIIFLSTSVFV